jgi:hypothetical protein
MCPKTDLMSAVREWGLVQWSLIGRAKWSQEMDGTRLMLAPKSYAFSLSHLFQVPRLVHSGRDDLQYLRQVDRTDTENTERASALLVGQPTLH